MRGIFVLGMVAALGCGEVIDANPDADGGTDDDGVDIDAAPTGGTVHARVLTTIGDGEVDMTAHVVIADAAGAIVADGPVDGAGNFAAEVPGPGASITVVRRILDEPTQTTAAVTTVHGISPGETASFGLERKPAYTGGPRTTMPATLQPTPLATGFQVWTECGGSTVGPPQSTVGVPFFPGCHGVEFEALTISTATPARWVRSTHIYREDETFIVPPFTDTIATYSVGVTGVTGALQSLVASRATVLGSTAIAPYRTTIASGEGNPSATMPYPAAAGTRSEIALESLAPATNTVQRLELRTADLLPMTSVAFTDLALPDLGESVVASPTGMSWTGGIADAGDGQRVQWYGSWMTTRSVRIRWTVFGPATATGITLPRLPPALAELDPQAQAGPVAPETRVSDVTMFDVDGVDGYAEARLRADQLTGDLADLEVAAGAVGVKRRLARSNVTETTSD